MFFTEARKYQAPLVSVKRNTKSHKEAHTDFWIKFISMNPFVPDCGSTAAEGFGAQGFQVMRIDMVTLDHAIESLAIDCQHSRCGLFVATRVFEHTRDVTPFDYG